MGRRHYATAFAQCGYDGGIHHVLHIQSSNTEVDANGKLGVSGNQRHRKRPLLYYMCIRRTKARTNLVSLILPFEYRLPLKLQRCHLKG